MASAEISRAETARAEGALRCQVVTPERIVVDQRVEFIAIPLYDGELGVLPGRAPLVGRLGFGELRTRGAGGESRHFVDGGFVQVGDDVVTVLTSRAMAVTELVADQARAELDRARALPGATDAELREKTRAIARARGLLRAAEAAS